MNLFVSNHRYRKVTPYPRSVVNAAPIIPTYGIIKKFKVRLMTAPMKVEIKAPFVFLYTAYKEPKLPFKA